MISYTQFGRVELDPIEVPVLKSPAGDEAQAFEQQLNEQDQLGADTGDGSNQEPSRLEAPVPENEIEAEAAAEPELGPETSNPANEARPKAEPQTERSGELPLRAEANGEQNSKGTAKSGVPVRQIAGKQDAGAPSSFTDQAEATIPTGTAALADSKGFQSLLTPVSPANSQNTNSQGSPTQLPGTARIEAVDKARAPQAAAGYRSLNKHMVQLAEQARESVFKQIAIKLGRDGGELNIRLDPPELGKLDLKMVVEKGNQMRLVIGAERPELANMLEKHAAELKAELAEQGITITETEIHARDQQAGRDAQELAHDFGNEVEGEETQEQEAPSAAQLRRGGFITGEGLDFWA